MSTYRWTPDMVRFLRDASEHSDYHEQLARRIAAYLPRDAHVCEAGCGLGHLSVALCGHARLITAVDIAQQAIDVLGREITLRGVDNIRMLCADIAHSAPEQAYDAMVFCFFGGVEQALAIARAQCTGPVILIKRDWLGHRFSSEADTRVRHTAGHAAQRLQALGVPYRQERFSLSMDQPFCSLEQAELFFRLYGGDAPVVPPQQLKKRLVAREHEKFPYWYPIENRLGMLIIDTKDIPATLS